jgi:hypothetical protein
MFPYAKREDARPPQQRRYQPGRQYKCSCSRRSDDEKYRGDSKLQDNVALIRGEGHRISRPITIHFVKKSADCPSCLS